MNRLTLALIVRDAAAACRDSRPATGP